MKRFAAASQLVALLAASAAWVPGAVEARAGDRGVAAPAAAAPVDRDSLEAAIRWLTIDPATGQPRTRFVLREEPLRVVADSLASRLERYTGNPVRRLGFSFDKTYQGIDSTYAAENLVARLDGTGAVDGALVLSAHFDAIASRTGGWTENWRTWPAPGANDNATGVAAVLEAARVLAVASPAPPFDILFMLFSCEEFDRTGSRDLVSRLGEVYGGRIIGVMNFDMIGHAPDGERGATVLSNPISGWLSEMLAASADTAQPELPLEVLNPGFLVSDHQSFWEARISAVLLMEPLRDDQVVYPYYHTVLDTLGRVDIEQTGRIADIAVGFVDALARSNAEIAMLASDILLRQGGLTTVRREFRAGDAIEVLLRARNIGAAHPEPGGSVRIEASLENAAGRRVIGETVLAAPGALDAVEIAFPVLLEARYAGENIVHAAISVIGAADDGRNNSSTLRFSVEAEGESVLLHAVQPNPVRGPFREAAFCLNLASPVDVYLELYTIEGERIGAAYMGERWGRPMRPGMNCLPMGILLPGVRSIASGMYLYRLIVYEGASQRKLTGRFAVER